MPGALFLFRQLRFQQLLYVLEGVCLLSLLLCTALHPRTALHCPAPALPCTALHCLCFFFLSFGLGSVKFPCLFSIIVILFLCCHAACLMTCLFLVFAAGLVGALISLSFCCCSSRCQIPANWFSCKS